jgi:hypothetical protein
MSEANREEFEAEASRKSLEALVTARTEQLRQAVQRNSDLLQFLKQIRSMQSLNEIHQAVEVEIAKLQSQNATTSVPRFGENPGEPVLEVDPEDLRSVWRETRDLQARHPGQNVAIDAEVIKPICKPTTNADAGWYRMSMLWLLDLVAPERISSWMKEGEPSDIVFRTIATIPMVWIGHTEREGLPFDVEEFFRRLMEGGV